MKMYLKQDIKGASSGIVYGVKDEEVEFIHNDRGVALVQKGDEKFYVLNSLLTDQKPEDKMEKEEKPVTPIINVKNISRPAPGKKKQSKTPVGQNNQINLF